MDLLAFIPPNASKIVEVGSALGASLRRLKHDTRLSSFILFENRRGLPDACNDRITSEKIPDILVFMGDNVWIDDYCIADRVLDRA
jgi:tRNA G46 methylase TrmB